MAALPPEENRPVEENIVTVMPPKEVGPIILRQAAANGDAKALFEIGYYLLY